MHRIYIYLLSSDRQLKWTKIVLDWLFPRRLEMWKEKETFFEIFIQNISCFKTFLYQDRLFFLINFRKKSSNSIYLFNMNNLLINIDSSYTFIINRLPNTLKIKFHSLKIILWDSKRTKLNLIQLIKTLNSKY